MTSNTMRDTGAATAAPVVLPYSILWLDYAGRVIGRTRTEVIVNESISFLVRERRRTANRIVVMQACQLLSFAGPLPRLLHPSEGQTNYWTIADNERHLVSGFRVVEGDE